MKNRGLFSSSVFLCFVVLWSFNIYAATIHVGDLHTAQDIATRISNVVTPSGKLKSSYLINTILADHSSGGHNSTDSYFLTNDRGQIEQIIQSILDAPDDFSVYTEHTRKGIRARLELRKEFSLTESHSIIGSDYIGRSAMYDSIAPNTNTNKVKIVFDITEINSLANIGKGGTITGFPAEDIF